MPLRTFRARDGSVWSVWRIESTVRSDVLDTPHEWLLFQDDDATERRRLVDFPENWEALPDERLELLCRMATPAKTWTTLSPPGGVPTIEGETTLHDRGEE